MKIDLIGRLKNTQLAKGKSLLPMFEAVVNSFQALEDRETSDSPPRIDVVIDREARVDYPLAGDVTGFTVIDNGVGFTDENFDSFFTSDTRHKVSRGGKGVGRFTWLKAFERATIDSHYRDNGVMLNRSFTFSPDKDQPNAKPVESKESEPKTTVKLIEMRSPYKEDCPLGIQSIARRLVEHCLPFFLDGNCPSVIIRDDSEEINLNAYFRDLFKENATEHAFKIGAESFRLRGLRVYSPQDDQHRLVYAANAREVMPERLGKYLPNLKRQLRDERGTFAYLGFLEGAYLDQRVNSERTDFSFPKEKNKEDLSEDLSQEGIRETALIHIAKDLKEFIDVINSEKRATIVRYITEEAPEYRPLLRHLNAFIDKIPPGTTGRELDAYLHELLYNKERELKQVGHDLIEQVENASLKPDEYRTRINSFLLEENELGKFSLAKYVTHRRIMLEFLGKSLRAEPGTNKYPLESVIHSIIYPMRTTSDEVPYEQQNLWIIDERLSYHWYLTSDLPLNRKSLPLQSDSLERPDICIFEHALTFTDDTAPLTSLVIVEFKQPQRQKYEEDPVAQVNRLILSIRDGHFKDKDGVEIKLQSSTVPAYAYIICDITKSIEDIAIGRGFTPFPDNMGYFFHNTNLQAYIEIISYQKLLRDAKRRNKILFDKLHLPLSH